MNTATESVCPKGWTLPTIKQANIIGPSGNGSSTYVASFNPARGGFYSAGTLYNDATRGRWWSSGTSNSATRHNLDYNGSNLNTSSGTRPNGFYIRCVSEEKTVTDLTYLQDMTGEIANNTLDGTTASFTGRKSSQTRYLQHHSSFILQ